MSEESGTTFSGTTKLEKDIAEGKVLLKELHMVLKDVKEAKKNLLSQIEQTVNIERQKLYVLIDDHYQDAQNRLEQFAQGLASELFIEDKMTEAIAETLSARYTLSVSLLDEQ